MLTIRNHTASFFCRCLVITLCISLATGCTTLKPLPYIDSQTVQSQIAPGDEIRLTTKDGRERDLKVKEVTAQQLIVEGENGESEKVNLSDINSLEVREFSGGKTAGLIGSGYVLFTVALMALLIVAVISSGVPVGGW